MKEQERQLEDERRRNQEELEEQMRKQLNEQQRLQQFREIDQRLQEIVPKIAELNIICREIGRDNVYYEPEIVTEVKTDGTKNSQIVVRVYPDRNNKDVSSSIPWDIFTDKVYFDVKDLYDDYEEKNFVIEEEIDVETDGEIFGWNLTDSW